ncbi:LuxR C-terminal-related transcriptional regulator [Rathayibacter sp. VKM Ac-2630]|uniref:LuxR C-terminal-related transcriptional regulator n=1 Tax=Rathayibacter sp. VKM Ac-2630 TaxID=1938617 RepID=UPI000981A9AE|nr:LuxR C-terminal-related transcriptional regulator [Rathayibacter sp. VKM Ac-2630]OOB91035.1 hypothetical protein B0T42_08185 [Rathayibacter sp. VKM Ac-2630]
MPESRHLAALRSAAESEEWDRTVELLEEHWPRLVHVRRAELLAILDRIPESVLDERPRWIRARDFVRSRSSAAPDADEDPCGIPALTSRIVELRRAGRAAEALPLVAQCRTLADATPQGEATTAGGRSERLFQWARALEDVGATSDAIDLYEAAARATECAPSAGRMRSLAGGAAALLAALHGERARAQRSLDEFCGGAEQPLGGGASAALAEALLRFDVLDREGARRLVDGIDPTTIRHRWAHYFHVRAIVEWEQRPRVLRAELDTQLRARPLSTLSEIDAGSVRITRYLLHAAAARPGRAIDALGSGTSISTILDHFTAALRAFVLTREGRAADARHLLAPLRAIRLAPRAELLVLVVGPDRSPDDLERIAALASEHGLYWLLTVLPEHDRATVSGLLARREPRVAPAGALEPTPALAPPLLTAREQEVAQRAALGGSTADIASALHVSPNTVKTQLRSVYRKLGVTTRSELFAALY